MKLVLFVVIGTGFLYFYAETAVVHRAKRADLLSQLTIAIQKVSEALKGPQSVNDLPAPVPSAQELGFCTQNPNSCKYLGCLAQNFQHSPQAANLKAGSKVIADPALRKAVSTDPAVARAACARANLTNDGCEKFKGFLGIVNVFDPDSAHADDEPRDKRSPFNDYGHEETRTSPPTVEPDGFYKQQDCEAMRKQLITAAHKRNGG